MRDFTLKIYEKLLTGIINVGYNVTTFEKYLSVNNLGDKIIILRHDIDKNPENALKIAKLEYKLMIRASYYFRIAKESYNESIIVKIAKMGHEIGYHYEDLSLAKGNFELAIEIFEKNLRKFRQFYPVKTICMHGSPFSRWDNRLIWQKYNYRNFNIIGEPYFDIDFNKVLYLTETGRKWNGKEVSVRDKVNSKFNYNFKSTFDIIKALNNNKLPDKLMINVHPQRWNDNLALWIKELVWQNTKNIGKQILVKLTQI
ncbi:MAG TPA: hypothetical protein ENI51_07450 [Candidatus Atribacteria bacterium]|nr:hypothetical protein [Candidatus Atribacteria bacterium]